MGGGGRGRRGPAGSGGGKIGGAHGTTLAELGAKARVRRGHGGCCKAMAWGMMATGLRARGGSASGTRGGAQGGAAGGRGVAREVQVEMDAGDADEAKTFGEGAPGGGAARSGTRVSMASGPS